MKTIQCDMCKSSCPIADGSDDYRVIHISTLRPNADPYISFDVCPNCLHKILKIIQKGE